MNMRGSCYRQFQWILPPACELRLDLDPKVGESKESERWLKQTVQDYLQAYLYELVGGNFASRYSAHAEDAPMAIDQYGREPR